MELNLWLDPLGLKNNCFAVRLGSGFFWQKFELFWIAIPHLLPQYSQKHMMEIDFSYFADQSQQFKVEGGVLPSVPVDWLLGVRAHGPRGPMYDWCWGACVSEFIPVSREENRHYIHMIIDPYQIFKYECGYTDNHLTVQITYKLWIEELALVRPLLFVDQ